MSDQSSYRGLAIYALPAIPLAALTLPLYSFIPIFYAESLGLSLASLGFVLFVVRLFDAINDPLVGWMSDRFRPKFGRRRTWFAGSIPLLMLGVWKLFWPPAGATEIYVGTWTLVLSIGYTCAILPYSAWGAELQTNYIGRSKVAGWREGFTLVGTLVAITVPFSLGWSDPASLHGFAVLAIIIVITLPSFAAIVLWKVPEPTEYSKKYLNFSDGLRHLRKNLPFKKLLLAFFLNGFGNSIAATLFLLYCAQRLELGDYRGALIFIYFLCGILAIPFWIWLAGKTSKHRAWCYAMIFAAIIFSPAPFLEVGSLYTFGVICIFSGVALGADITQPAAIQADVIDVDTANSGDQRSGTYFAFWSLATKLSLALTVVIVLPVLEHYGFSAALDSQSTAIGITLLGFIYGWGPILLKAPAVLLMWNFPLGKLEVEQLRTKIDA